MYQTIHTKSILKVIIDKGTVKCKYFEINQHYLSNVEKQRIYCLHGLWLSRSLNNFLTLKTPCFNHFT